MPKLDSLQKWNTFDFACIRSVSWGWAPSETEVFRVFLRAAFRVLLRREPEAVFLRISSIFEGFCALPGGLKCDRNRYISALGTQQVDSGTPTVSKGDPRMPFGTIVSRFLLFLSCFDKCYVTLAARF